jgi:hypothetical protein
MSVMGEVTHEGDVWFSGIDGDRGTFHIPPMTADALASEIASGWQTPHEKQIQGSLAIANARKLAHFGTIPWFDDLHSVRWAAVFPEGVKPEIIRAVEPLVSYRNGSKLIWRKGRDAHGFLADHNVMLGNRDFERVPFYLLLIADPAVIPFAAQYQLGVDYAVGRLWLNPTELSTYTRQVIENEARDPTRKAAIFAPATDEATRLSASQLATPVAAALQSSGKVVGSGWQIQSYLQGAATKQALTNIITGGSEHAQLVFTATHGVSFGSPQKRRKYQGGLICQDWPGSGPVPADAFFSASDIPDDAQLRGSILIHFACFGAGTPALDGFWFQRKPPLPPRTEFLAKLPLRAVAKGALAVVGHIDLAWSTSFCGRSSPSIFSDALTDLAQGVRLGNAISRFPATHAALAIEFAGKLDEHFGGKALSSTSLVDLWLAKNDLRSYSIIGDPAVRLKTP